MIDYKSYWVNGMGLHETQLKELKDITLNENIKNIVEFGSGRSTQFFLDIENEYNLNFKLTSFDHNKRYAHKNNCVTIKELEQCDDESFELIFKSKKINKEYFVNAEHEQNNFKAKNCFYALTENDLPNNIDLIILDGPNGNGRSLAFPYIMNKISNPCYIMIDDVDHYDFLERAKQIFDYEIITHINDKKIHHLFSYALLKINI